MPSQEGDSSVLNGVSNAWPITLLMSMAVVKRLIYVTWSLIHPHLSHPHLFPVILLTSSLVPMGRATKDLMMSLTSDLSVGNYNICRHDKAACKDGSRALFWCNSSSPAIMSGFGGGAVQSWWGHVGGMGLAILCSKKGAAPQHRQTC